MDITRGAGVCVRAAGAGPYRNISPGIRVKIFAMNTIDFKVIVINGV